MADLFILSIGESNLVYHKRFAFSIDYYILDPKKKKNFWMRQGINLKEIFIDSTFNSNCSIYDGSINIFMD